MIPTEKKIKARHREREYFKRSEERRVGKEC